MSTESAKRTHCPVCGARITRPELSLCSYCSTPLALGEKPGGGDAATLQRLARMHEHKDWEEAHCWTPTESDDAPGAARKRARAAALLAFGLVLLAWTVASNPGGLRPVASSPVALLGILLLAVGVGLRARAGRLLSRVRQQALQKRAALVTDRRSVTDSTSLGSRTVYFFALQFEDGSAGEYSFPGRGANYEVPTAGATGVACTRGARLLEFLRIRV